MAQEAIRHELQTALAGQDHFEAFAVLELDTDQLLALETVPLDGLKPALEAFLLRVLQADSDLLQDEQEVTFYDLEGRQIVYYLMKINKRRYIFLLVAAPQKTYKQLAKRLLKTVRAELEHSR
jgi:hypothetical protein